MSFFKKQKKNPYIYLDHAAGTPIDPDVFEMMEPYLKADFFNPGAIYTEAFRIREVLHQARTDVADALSCRSQELMFCDGGTEANNLAIRGLVSAWRREHAGQTPHIITSAIEHASILETCRALEKDGLVTATYLNVDEVGLINLKELKEVIGEQTILISIGYVNGEIGVIQDIRAITKTVRHYRKHNESVYPYVHTDAVQAVNYSPINVQKLGIDMMTINASKIYGPKKIATLYKKSTIIIDPIITGGTQEFGLRAGTENIPAIVGMAVAVKKTRSLLEAEMTRLEDLQRYFINQLQKHISDMACNTNVEYAIPNIVNISIPDISSEEIVLRLDAVGIKASVKSACKSGEEGGSHVIRALRDYNTQSIRFSMGRDTQEADINTVIRGLARIVDSMRDIYKKYYLNT